MEKLLFFALLVGVLGYNFYQGRAAANSKGRGVRRPAEKSPFEMGSMIGLESRMPGIGINKRYDD